jgi:replicative DNA helicase
VDIVTTTARLNDGGRMQKAGGAAYVSSLIESLPDVANVEHYAKLVRDDSVKRGILKANMEGSQAAASDWRVDEIIENQIHELTQLQQEVLQKGEPEQIGGPAQRAYERIEAIKAGDVTQFGWKTGLKVLDSRFGYLAPKNLYVVAGTASAGKSALVDQIADRVADDGGTVAIFCLEMSLEQRAERFLARRTSTTLEIFKDPQYIPASVMEKLRAEAERLKEPPILLDDTRGIKPADISARCKKIKNRHGLDLVIIDYLQLVTAPYRGPREQQVAETVNQINTMAGDLEVPVLLCSQLSRTHQHEGRRPEMYDLRESGRIEQDAFGVIMVYRPDLEKDDCEILIRKNRQGPVGMGRMMFRGPHVRFDNRAPEREEHDYSDYS